jgi:tetratricopeptide (TPR) repeat protein
MAPDRQSIGRTLDYYVRMSRIPYLMAFAMLALAPGAHAQSAKAPLPETVAADNAPERSALNASIFYQVMLAELSFNNGDIGAAYSLMLHAARESNEAQLFQRAVDIGLSGRDANAAVSAAKAWQQALPQSQEADRYLLQLLIGLNRLPETLAPLQRSVARAAQAERAALITALTRLYLRANDKAAAADVVEKALAAELGNRSSGPASWAAIGNLRLMAGNRAAALAAARKGAALAPLSDDIASLAINLLDGSGEDLDALLTNYFAATPSANVRMGYVRKLIDLQRYPQALVQATLLTQAQPDYADAWLVRGSIEFRNQDLQKAEQSLNRYLAALPSSRAQEDSDEDSLTPRGIVQAYLLLSQIAEKQGDFVKAQSFLARINSPQDIARVQIRRAMMFAKQGRMDEALSLVRNLPEDDADQARSKLQAQLQILREGRREDEAYALISQANQKAPDDVDLLYDLALSAEKLGRPDEMEKILRRVITLQPDYHAAYNALGYSLADRNQRLPEARDLIEKALKFAPNDPFILDSLAWVEFRSGNKAEAVRILRAAYSTRPDAEIAAHLGEVLWAMNLRAEANAAWAKGLELNRDNDTLKSTILRLRGSK